MKKQIRQLNTNVSKQIQNTSREKQNKAKIVFNIIFYQIGYLFQLPFDMCREICFYLFYDTRTLAYQYKKQSDTNRCYFYQMLLHSIPFMSRYQEQKETNNKIDEECWSVQHCFYRTKATPPKIISSNCSTCGNYNLFYSYDDYSKPFNISCFC